MRTMQANSPAALLLSFLLHGMVAALLFFMAYVVGRQTPQPAIFELVAGAPTAPDELTAPALGSPDAKLTLKVPEAPAPRVEPQEKVPEMTAVPEPVKPPAKIKPAPPKEAPQAPRLTKEEFEKRYGKPQPVKTAQAPPPVKAPRIDAKGIAEGVRGGSPANTRGGGGGNALSRERMDPMSEYITTLKLRLKQAHEKPVGVSELLSADVEFFVAANGQIDNVRIVRSSRNAEFDRSVLDAFRNIAWLGPRPDGKSDVWRLTFRMKEE